MSGTAMLRQLHFSMIDLVIHSIDIGSSDDTPQEIFARLGREGFAVCEPFEGDRFLNSFSHIFAGGYAAGYFSYKWSEVLSADCFAAFEEVGIDDDKKVREMGQQFISKILAVGGGIHPSTAFENFRGRKPSSDALLRHSGLQ